MRLYVWSCAGPALRKGTTWATFYSLSQEKTMSWLIIDLWVLLDKWEGEREGGRTFESRQRLLRGELDRAVRP